jgi:cyanuric acid amidohydrolase
MKAQRVEMFVVPMDAPNDVSGLQALADDGRVTPETLVAIVGKTDGTGFHDDWGRVFADVALRGWTAAFLGIPV